MKHVGLNVAADPLMTSAYTGVTGGFVVMSADDPFAHSSQNEQDSRYYAKFAQIPCLDPATPQEAHDMTRDAFGLSEELSLPVIIRPTTRVCHSKSNITLGQRGTSHRKGEFKKDPRQYVVIPAHTRILHDKLNIKQPIIREHIVKRGYNWHMIRGNKAVLSSGVAASYVLECLPETISFAKIGAYPIDGDWLSEFLSRHEEVLVIEELSPIVEDEVRARSTGISVHGKRDGAVPSAGELSPAVVADILLRQNYIRKSPYPKPHLSAVVPPRPPIMCAGCTHRATFYAMKKVFRDAIYPSDIGCYTLGLQLGAVDTTICMGASITIGSGIRHSGEQREVVCTIGDSTFLHTGIPGLLNAVYNESDMVVVILDNRTTAMTGHQPNPTTGITATGEPSIPVSIEALCRACGVQFVETTNPYDLPGTLQAFRQAKERPGVKVIIAKQPCVITARRSGITRRRYSVKEDACSACGSCVRFGCPAIELIGEHAVVNELCSGCGVCSSICPQGAIVPEGRA
jgi:indolepyruvate ferredoxin oxidoreductase alpha subunit